MAKYRRNDPCPCGSGKKYKFCCLRKTDSFSEQNFTEGLNNTFSENGEFNETGDSLGPFPASLEEEIKYDPMKAPDKDEWLSLDEIERAIIISDYHKRKKITLPNIQLHAITHATIENQLAENIPEVVATLKRLMSEGLDRHEAIHAIGSVLAGHIYKLLKDKPNIKDPNKPYLQELNSLTAESWYEESKE
jgi:hypothetical protein